MKTLLEEMRLECSGHSTRRRGSPSAWRGPLLEMGSLAAALRAAAVSAGAPASVEVTAGSSYPSEVVRTVARQILIEQRLYAEVEDAVDVEPVGELVLKGFSRPVAAFDVVAVRETAAGLSAVRGS